MTFVAHAQMRGLRGTCKEVPNGVHAPCAPVTPPIHSKVMPTGACPCGEQPHGWCATWVPEPRGPSLPNNGAQLGLIIIGNHSASLVAVATVHDASQCSFAPALLNTLFRVCLTPYGELMHTCPPTMPVTDTSGYGGRSIGLTPA